jgi:hypothetical protein
MDRSQFNRIFDATVLELRNLLKVKGGEYANEDVLANFKRGAALVGVNPLTCLFIYMSKHYDAVATYVKDKQTGQDRPRSEPILGRLDDLMNYAVLAKALIAEEAGVEVKSWEPELMKTLHLKHSDHRVTVLDGPEAVRAYTSLPIPGSPEFAFYQGKRVIEYSVDGGPWVII